MTTEVEILKVNETDRHEGTLTFGIKGRQYDAFYWGYNFKPGDKVEVTLTQLEYPLTWDTIFGENKRREKKIEKSKTKDWTYHCYGTIQSVKPVVANFGDFQLDLGGWTNDPKVVGEHIYWTVDRLDIQRADY
ncbi:hypothetical protein [Parachryseolinea silvisoli]|uniref:hypothetical protein n=1 Tax=Parachryseolinea silvisoli TaxID=2873601 RepID=UPI002265E86E|nr:hypothetical protein [Parachryseolinea silvisoli]MCD9014432.1 hypothetical protein [Parachryseolinea silvisoli]